MGSIQKLAGKSIRTIRLHGGRIVRWWVHNDRKYRMKWRIANTFAAVLIVVSISLPVMQNILNNRRYRLSQETLNLVGKSNQALASKLKFNTQKQTYEFNKEALKTFNPTDAQQEQVGSADDKTKSLYALDVPADIKQGVTYHDVNSQLSFKLVPEFSSLPGKTEQGRIVFPLDGGPQAVYTMKNNGLKEDIVVTNSRQNSLRFTYKLDIPKTLEAKQLPDGSGAIGLYSADPTLFTNMSYGSDKDRELVEKARENAEKTNLVFGIPAPVITAKNGKIGNAYARFELRGDQLTVVGENLSSIHGTYSIDPSVIVTSTADFQDKANNEGNIDFSTSGQISRAGLTGGSIGSWSAQTSLPAGTLTAGGASGVYNGYIYIVQGTTTASPPSVKYAQLSTSGTITGSWQDGTPFPASRADTASFIYNGYLYALGGVTGTSEVNTVIYAKLNVNGTGSMGSWQTASSTFANARQKAAAVAYNGYAYISGGLQLTTYYSDIQYAPILATGDLGAWTTLTTTPLPSTRAEHYLTASNGYVYVAGGLNASGGVSGVSYAKLNADGTISSWIATTSLLSASSNYRGRALIYNGYMYTSGGLTNGGGANTATAYAQIQANGALSSWNTTTALSSDTGKQALVAYSGYLFSVGGVNTGGTAQLTAQSAKIDTPGTTGNYSASSTYNASALINYASVATGGYIYLIGGTTANTGGNANQLNTARYAQVNADGTLGTWNTTTSNYTNLNPTGTGCSPTECSGRLNPVAGAYNGYIYIAGGVSNGTAVYWSDIQSAVVCTGLNIPVSGCAGAGDLRGAGGAATWSTQLKDFIGNSTTTYSQANARAQMGMQIYNGYMYLVGGSTGSGGNTGYVDIYYASLTTTGGVGTFAATTSLPDARASVKTFVMNGRFYVVGGGTGSGWAFTNSDKDDVLFTTINPATGALSSTCPSGYTCLTGTAWVDANAVANGGSGSSFATSGNLSDYGMVMNDGYVYIAGGQNGTSLATTYSTVYKAKINTNGSMGAWTTTTNMGSSRNELSVFAVNGNLYTIGGCLQRATLVGQNCVNVSSMLNDYQYSAINNGGSDYMQAGANKGSFTSARSQASAVAYNGYIYLSGGCTSITAVTTNSCATSTNDTRYASIAADGTLTWNTLTAGNPVTNRYGHALAAYNGSLYVIGGCSSTGGFCSGFLGDIQYVALNSSTGDSSGSWKSNPTSLATARYGLSASIYNGYMYAIGGCSATTSGNCSTFQNSVEYAQINADGSVGSFASTGGTGFTTGRFMQNAVAYSGNLYVVAGCSAMSSGNCSTIKDDVQFAAINSNGTVSGTWNVSTSIAIARYGASMSARNGYLYLTGGCSANSSGNCSAFQIDVQTSPIYSDGSIGAWSVRNNAYTDPRYMHNSVIANGYVFILGGIKTGPTLLADSQGAGSQLQTRSGRYTKLIDLGRENAKINNIVYNGALSDGLSNVSFKVASTASPTFSASYNVPLSVDTACSAGLAATKVRYVLVSVVLDDMAGGVGGTFGEATTANMTDFTLRYNYIHPDPNIRLRLGQTLQENDVLSPFDTCI